MAAQYEPKPAPEVVNNLTTNDSTKALSAAMGKSLSEQIGTVSANTPVLESVTVTFSGSGTADVQDNAITNNSIVLATRKTTAATSVEIIASCDTGIIHLYGKGNDGPYSGETIVHLVIYY